MPDITNLLNAMHHGQTDALAELLPKVYEELRQLAAKQLSKEQPGQTLQPTALVHEAYLRLVPKGSSESDQAGTNNYQNRKYFFGAAAEAMRRILVENARRKQAIRHGGNMQRLPLDPDQFLQEKQGDELISVHEALNHLATHDALKAELVKLRYFAGFTNEETAELLGITPKSAEKHWVYARAWLKRYLSI
jgi:RNA polymerase sigma factor (TIGR02999 family)